ncbi:hypothetical protein RSSM_03698 [Rhodopirellula sallentina SM41]|uniref:Uncharacterized protein n=1 Tax=Rhodopirellula sallentina SM41 TaxID=1263870 RepID=M5U095_9BACT|nr:hypothetical protein RSSM_03698 [Rhodopirellula sallentina SM41]
MQPFSSADGRRLKRAGDAWLNRLRVSAATFHRPDAVEGGGPVTIAGTTGATFGSSV